MDTVVTTRESSTFWTSLAEAFRGTHQDFTTGSLTRAIFLLAVPMVLEMLMESLFAIVDVFWVAHLGPDAVATVGLTEAVLALVYAAAMGLALSTTAMVARRVGEKDATGAAVAAVQSIILGATVSSIAGGACSGAAPWLLHIMGASPQVIQMGTLYARIALAGSAAVFLLFLNNAVFRGAGDAALAMRVLWISNSVNIVLDPCFIFGLGPFPRLGVAGAAVATLLGRSFGVFYQFYWMLRGTERIHILLQHVRVNWSIMWRLVRVSLSGILQFLIANTSWVGLVRIVGMFGSAAIASYTVAIRIIIFVIMPSWGLSNAAATLVGQNLGARQPERAEKAVWLTGFYNMLFLGAVGVFFIAFADPLVRLFTSDPSVAPLAASCLRLLSYGNLAYAMGMVMVQAFNGAGDTITPTILNLFCFWLGELPLAYWLAMYTHLQARAVFMSIPIAEGALALISLLVFRQGRWKQQKI